MTDTTLQSVAAARGWQTLAQSLAVDVGLAVAFVALAQVGDVASFDELAAPALWLAVTKSVIQAGAAWVVRRWLDQSGFNADGSPLPVAYTPERAAREGS